MPMITKKAMKNDTMYALQEQCLQDLHASFKMPL